jgi:nucleotide-binding universal stress UspA family protein
MRPHLLEEENMTTTIVSYDGTSNDDDALELARLLADAGARLILAYVRHAAQPSLDREALEEQEAERLLDRALAALDGIQADRRVTVHGSTSEGLRSLAESEAAELIVFGSEYRTAPGRVAPQRSTRSLLEGGPAAVAIAPSGYVAAPIRTIGLLTDLADHAAIDTAHALAGHFDATVTDGVHGVDLLIVGSRPEAPTGRTMISARAENALEGAMAPVLVVARGVALEFRAPLYVS